MNKDDLMPVDLQSLTNADRLLVGEEKHMPRRSGPCESCGRKPGDWHRADCPLEECPACGDKLAECGCYFAPTHEFNCVYALEEIDDDTEIECWCGEKGKYADLFDDSGLDKTCGGLGILHCRCGGDLCVCHHHGETECLGCEDCEGHDDEQEEEEA